MTPTGTIGVAEHCQGIRFSVLPVSSPAGSAPLLPLRLKLALAKIYRYVYTRVSGTGCKLMAFEFEYKGIVYRADTVADLMAIRTEVEKAKRDPERSCMERVLDFWTPERFMDVMTAAGDLQRRLLLAVYQQPNITGRELASVLEMESEFALAGVISGLSKQLKPLGIKLEQVLLINVRWSAKTKTRRFMLEDFFVSAGAQQGWPIAWGGNPKTTTTRKRRAVKNSRATKTTKAGE